MNYTRGEWKAFWDYLGGYDCMSHSYRIASGEQTIAVLDVSDYEATNQDGDTEEEVNCLEAKANAHLISAAPDMYELLTEICEAKLDADTLRILQPWFNKIIPTLAKAEGKEE